MNAKTLAALSAALFFVGSAQAAGIPGLYNTGVDANGVLLTGNGQDSHYTLTWAGSPSPEHPYTGATGAWPINPWVADGPSSRWLTPTSNAADSFDPFSNGFYDYTLQFTLTAGQANGASFSGAFAADNEMSEIALNGHEIYSGPGYPTSQFTSWTDFGASSNFVAGLNTLTFGVENYAQNGGNPTGLDVQFLSSSAGSAPEASTWAMMILGFTALALAGYRASLKRAVAA